MSNLNVVTPIVHHPVQSDLKQLVVPFVLVVNDYLKPKWLQKIDFIKPPEASVSHHHSVVELIQWPFPLGRPVIVEKLDQNPVPLMEPKLETKFKGCHHLDFRSNLVVVVSSVVRANEASLHGFRG